MNNNSIVIVGAGLTGLVLGSELSKKGYKVTIIENDVEVGGLAKTRNLKGVWFDLGPHRFYSSDKRVLDYVFKIANDDLLQINRNSLIYCKGRYYNWPLQFKDVFKLPLAIAISIFKDFVVQCCRRESFSCIDFAHYLKKNYGPTIYSMFFKDIVSKLFSLAGEHIHWSWAESGIDKAVIEEHIYSRNLIDIISMVLKPRDKNQNYYYIKGGLGCFVNRLKDIFIQHGGTIETEASIERIELKGGIIKKVYVKGKTLSPSLLIWTAPLDNLASMLNFDNFNLKYQSISIVCLLLKEEDVLRDFQWCYYSSREISFYRAYFPHCFSASLVKPGYRAIVLECGVDETLHYKDSVDLFKQKIIKDLVNVGLIKEESNSEILETKILTHAYPIYALDYLEEKDVFLNYITGLKNIKLAGRQGLFWYNNMDECIKNALDLAESINSE